MKSYEVGYVVEFNDNITRIKLGRHSECKSCGACSGSSNIIIPAKNPVGAKAGDNVYVEMPQNNIISSIYIVYIQPLLLVFIGTLIGNLLAVFMNKSVILFQVVFGSIFFTLSIIIIKLCDKKVAKKENNLPTIIKVIS